MKVEWIIPKEIWNHAARALLRSRPRAGRFCILKQDSDGTVISADPGAMWQHPWFTVPSWTGKRWAVTVKPGFVNGWDPLCPGVGENGADVDLLDGPSLPINAFREPGYEGDTIPAYFLARGVRKPTDGFLISGDSVKLQADDNPLPVRVLRAVDFYLSIARPTYASSAQQIDASGTSGVIVDYSVSYNTAVMDRLGTRPRLMQVGKYVPARKPTLAERLLGTYQDEAEDRTLISTVYFLSPPNQDGGTPDATWTPIVTHNQFWNLHHRPRNIAPAKDPAAIRLATGLPLADLIGNMMLTGVNEYADRVLAAVNNTIPEGRYWTA